MPAPAQLRASQPPLPPPHSLSHSRQHVIAHPMLSRVGGCTDRVARRGAESPRPAPNVWPRARRQLARPGKPASGPSPSPSKSWLGRNMRTPHVPDQPGLAGCVAVQAVRSLRGRARARCASARRLNKRKKKRHAFSFVAPFFCPQGPHPATTRQRQTHRASTAAHPAFGASAAVRMATGLGRRGHELGRRRGAGLNVAAAAAAPLGHRPGRDALERAGHDARHFFQGVQQQDQAHQVGQADGRAGQAEHGRHCGLLENPNEAAHSSARVLSSRNHPSGRRVSCPCSCPQGPGEAYARDGLSVGGDGGSSRTGAGPLCVGRREEIRAPSSREVGVCCRL